jgi:flagellar protein FlgJ
MDELKARLSLDGMHSNQQLEHMRSKSNEREAAKLEGACRDFESLFLAHMLKEMRATIPKTGFLNGGHAEDIFTSMLDGEVSKELAHKGGIGLAEKLRNYVQNLEKKGAQ